MTFFGTALLRRSTHIARDRRGNVAVIFGLTLLPMMGAVGLAIDFGNVMVARTQAQTAADAAALQASGVARDLVKNGDGSAAATTAAITEAKTRATALFRAHAQQEHIPNAAVNVTVVRVGQELRATADFSVQTPNSFGKLFGQPTFKASGSVSSSATLPAYSDVYVALDISQSMGIASTQAGMNTLYTARAKKTDGSTVQTSCVFGCHTVESGMAESNQAVAKRYGVQLRIDVLRDATTKMITTAQSDSDQALIYRLALYTMGMTAAYTGPQLKQLAALSNNFTALSAAAATIDLGPSPGNGYSDSYLNENMASLAAIVPTSSDGTSQTNSKKYAFIITDGVRDIQSASQCVQTGNRCVSALSQTSCDDMKNRGITVGVLYTTYSPINPIAAGTNWYQVQVVNTGVAAASPPALKGCASPGWYFEASDATGIDKALQTMFAQTTYAPSLTN